MSVSRSHRNYHRPGGMPRRRNHALKLGFESLEKRYCLAAEMGGGFSDEAAPIISEHQAMALALNDLVATDEGFILQNRRHTATFTTHGLLMEPANGGLQWQWQLSYVGSPTDQLAQVPLDSVAPESNSRNLVTYDRGLLTEQYVLQWDSIEQQFVIPEALSLDGGDLIVAGTIHSGGDFDTIAAGWEWRTESGVISLGDVTVFDATGSVIPASMQVTANETRIVIAAEVLAEASYPLLIDPEVGTNDFRISDMGPGATAFAAHQPAVAFNSTNNEYLVVWNGDHTTDGEFEIFGERIDAATGNEIGQDNIRISDMGPDGDTAFTTFSPAVAYNVTNNEYLVVWSGDSNRLGFVDNEREIFGQRLDATGAEVGANDFRISDMGPNGSTSFSAIEPAVAHNFTTNEYLVVWEGDDDTAPLVDNEREIFGQRINAATGVHVGTNDFRISDMGPDGDTSFAALDPAVVFNKSSNQFLVVWQGDDNIAPLVNNEQEIFGQRLDAAGAAVGANDFRISDMGPNGSTIFIAQRPAVVHNTTLNQYLVVWQGDDNTSPLVDNEFEIFGQRLDAVGLEQGANDFRISDMGTDGNTLSNASTPAVVFDRVNSQYLVTWVGDDGVSPLVDDEFEVYGQRLDMAGTAVGTNDFRISDVGPDGVSTFDASFPTAIFNFTDNEFLVVWSGDDSADEANEIYGQRLDGAGAAVGANDIRFTNMGTESDFNAFEPAVAYNSVQQEYLVVWAGDDVDQQFEIFGQRVNATTGVDVGINDFQISFTIPEDSEILLSAAKPAVAFGGDEYLVVWDADIATNQETEILGQRLNASDGSPIGSNFRISDMGPDGVEQHAATEPAVAFNSTNGEFFVVWRGDDVLDGEFEIFGQRLLEGAAVGTNDFRISDMGPEGNISFDAFIPAVAYNALANEYLVVWQGDDNLRTSGDEEFEIFGQRLNASTGAQVGINDFRISEMGPALNPAFGASFAAIAASNNGFLVVWQGDDDAGSLVDDEFEIFGQAFKYVAGDLVIERDDFRISDMGPDGNRDFDATTPSVTFSNGGEFTVVWSGDDNTSPLVQDEFEIFSQQILASGAIETGPNDFRISDMGPDGTPGGFGAVFPALVADTNSNRVLVVWSGVENGGSLGDGEREIFGQFLEVGDFGDAPASYSTLQANSGAWHALGSPWFLGATVDGDANGAPTDNATGDDTSGSDDEDGVTLEILTPGTLSTVRVIASAAGKLDAFIDFNRDGDFADTGEKIFNSLAVAGGTNSLTFAVPETAVPGGTFARFRLSSAGGLSFSGRAADGEVEDYAVNIEKVCFGTADADVLVLRPASSPAGTVLCKRVTPAGEVTVQTFASNERIVVMSLAGADNISTASGISRGVVIDGGIGNDHIVGGPAADLLLGGEGNDWLIGAHGRDVLIGGTGTDVLLGGLPNGNVGSGDDNLLIGDSTIYDKHAQALREILAEWSSSDGFVTRVSKIRNGIVSPPLTPATVVDDHYVDLLVGSSSRNWFWKLSLDLLTLFGADDELN